MDYVYFLNSVQITLPTFVLYASIFLLKIGSMGMEAYSVRKGSKSMTWCKGVRMVTLIFIYLQSR